MATAQQEQRPTSPRFVDFATLKLTHKPNQCLMAPPGHCLEASPHFNAPVLKYGARELHSKLSNCISSEKRWTEVQSDEKLLRIKFVSVSKLLRFKDDIDIECIALGDSESTLAVYSRSRVGYGDMNANRKRVELLVSKLGATAS